MTPNISMTPAVDPSAGQADISDRFDLPAEETVRSEYLLVCKAKATSIQQGHWHFTLEQADGTPVFDAGDEEQGDLNRLTLLAAVRGLEAIDGAASVTLLSNNRYLIRSLTDSLPRWRANDFVWEHFGRRMEVQHADLWRRISGALAIHRVEACLISSRLISTGVARPANVEAVSSDGERRSLRVDAPHDGVKGPRGAVGRREETRRRREANRRPYASPPHDRLRHWLMAGISPEQTTRHRFTSADLMETA